MIKYLFII